MNDIPLGKQSTYPDSYSTDLLVPIRRASSREPLGIGGPLPFRGVDIWNAWELTWLQPGGKPVTAVAELRIPADSESIVESKSLKLYLNGFAMTEYRSADELAAVIEADVGQTVGAPVGLRLTVGEPDGAVIDSLPGECLDDLDVQCHDGTVDPTVLRASDDETVEETLYSHLLRSLCPVTNQPDFGSVLVAYVGPRIDRAALLRYLVSFRQHNDFHEACVERMFVEILARCRCQQLTVSARYNRRGGIDINPWRSNTDNAPHNLRLWRQ
ncbi:MAG: NADPH-dependent 7-cyano-7-deazaguanine reductase QueF [Pseudomonadota bacterium]